jgi:hypothetical protein
MPRLPLPGQDAGTWGTVLNEYLSQSHATDGSLKADVVGTTHLQAASITSAKLAPGAVTTAALTDGSVTAAKVASDVATQAELEAALAALGSLYAPQVTVLANDDFSRHPDGPLNGRMPIVGPAWVTSGSVPTVILDGQAVSTGTGYASLTLSEAPTYIECVQVFAGTGASSSNTLSWARTPFDNHGLDDLLHFNYGPGGFSLTLRQDGTTFDSFMSGSWRRKCARDGVTRYRVAMYVRNETVTVVGPGGEMFSGSDPRVAILARSRTIFMEPVGYGSASDARAVGFAALRRAEDTTTDTYRQPSSLDLAAFVNGGGRMLAGGETWFETMIGQGYTSGMPSVTFGPRTVRTRLAADLPIGSMAIVTEEPVPSGSIQIGGGNAKEIVTGTGNPSPLPGNTPPHTLNLTAATTIAHAVGDVVVSTGIGTTHSLQYNSFSPIAKLEMTTSVNLLSGDYYRAGTKVVSARNTGWTAATGTSTKTTFDTTTVTTQQLAERVKALMDALIAHGLIGT